VEVVEAVPPVTVTGLPRSVDPTTNCTVPGAAAGETVAVRVTDVPSFWGLAGVADTVVVVAVTGSTTKGVVPVEPAYPLPEAAVKTAWSVRFPTGSEVVVVEAVPPLTVTGLPMGVVPFSNCTVPVAAVGVTVAVSRTEAPWNTGPLGTVCTVVVVDVSGATTKDVVPIELA